MINSKDFIVIYNILREAGNEITKYDSSGDYDIDIKSDNSPVTSADLISDRIIRKCLSNNFVNVPVLSEEDRSNNPILKPEKFWLLDPLDGTKEFIKGNGEYCISLALIFKGRPIEGYIYAPVSKDFWFAKNGKGAFLIKSGSPQKLPLHLSDKKSPYLLLKSRSHHGKEESECYRRLSVQHSIKFREQGSAIKFCKIAEGEADLYIKKSKIYGWDIAAGDLILRESGGGIISFQTRKEINYSFDSSLMPHFLAYSSRINMPLDWL